jgi:hypothetical protein
MIKVKPWKHNPAASAMFGEPTFFKAFVMDRPYAVNGSYNGIYMHLIVECRRAGVATSGRRADGYTYKTTVWLTNCAGYAVGDRLASVYSQDWREALRLSGFVVEGEA